MTFKQSITRCLQQAFRFSGRATRQEFWYFSLFCTLLYLPAIAIDASLEIVYQSQNFTNLISVVIFVPSTTVAARRLHDINRSGWWWFLALVPLLGIIVLIYWTSKEGDSAANDFGDRWIPPSTG